MKIIAPGPFNSVEELRGILNALLLQRAPDWNQYTGIQRLINSGSGYGFYH